MKSQTARRLLGEAQDSGDWLLALLEDITGEPRWQALEEAIDKLALYGMPYDESVDSTSDLWMDGFNTGRKYTHVVIVGSDELGGWTAYPGPMSELRPKIMALLKKHQYLTPAKRAKAEAARCKVEFGDQQCTLKSGHAGNHVMGPPAPSYETDEE